MAESRIIRAAAAQIAPDLHEASRTLARVLEAIDEAAEQGAEIIVFPETFVPYYPYFSFITPAISAGAAHLKLYERPSWCRGRSPAPSASARVCAASWSSWG